MKLEIVKGESGVEIHLQNDDGSKTVWLCDNEQAALFKLASLIFSAQEDPKEAKRSILVGEFERQDARKRSLEERAKNVSDALAKMGLVKKEPKKDALDLEELMKQLAEKYEMAPPTFIPMKPSVPNYPTISPFVPVIPSVTPLPWGGVIPQDVYIGDLPGSMPIIDVFTSGQGMTVPAPPIVTKFDLDEQDLWYGSMGMTQALMEDKPLGLSVDSNGMSVSVFKTSIQFKATG